MICEDVDLREGVRLKITRRGVRLLRCIYFCVCYVWPPGARPGVVPTARHFTDVTSLCVSLWSNVASKLLPSSVYSSHTVLRFPVGDGQG
jgi:hypothetical protein